MPMVHCHRRRERGSTLVELLVAIPSVLAVTGAAMALVGVFAGDERRVSERTGALADRQVAMDRITRDIRQAGAATVLGGGAGLQLTTYVFQDRVKRLATVTYDCSTGACRRTVAPATSGPTVIDGVLNPTSVFTLTGPRHVTVTLRLAAGTVTDGAQLVNVR